MASRASGFHLHHPHQLGGAGKAGESSSSWREGGASILLEGCCLKVVGAALMFCQRCSASALVNLLLWMTVAADQLKAPTWGSRL